MSENWDEYAKDWDQDECARLYAEKAFASLIKRVDVRKTKWKSKRVLDFGCGTGLLTETISPLVKEVIAVDTSEKMIEELKGKQISNVTAMCVDVNSSDVKQETVGLAEFDLIVASSVCSFLPDYETIVKVLSYLLVPKGYFVQWDWLSSDDSDFGLTAKRIENALDGADYKNICVEPVFSLQTDEEDMPVLMGVGMI